MIGIIGINHNTAAVEVRERYALTEADAPELVERWKERGEVLGAIVLSTCNRIEIYYETSQQHFRPHALIKSLSRYKQVEQVEDSIFICKQGEEAIRHLFRLASGLESMVMGETQILGQLKDAFRRATENKHSTSILSRMFHKAFETAKLVRNNFLVAATPISSGAAAVNFMDKRVPNREVSTLIVGAGQMSETIIDSLHRLKYGNVKIYNRTRERAERFSETHGHIPFYAEDRLEEAIRQADLIFVATSSLMPIVTKKELDGRQWTNRCYLFDMAVPRNIAQDVCEYKQVELYTIDDLRHTPDGALLEEPDYVAIDRSIRDMVVQFMQWIDASAIREVIRVIQHASDSLLEKELAKLPSQMDDTEREIITQYDQHLRVTFSTALVAATRKITEDGKNLKYSEAIGKLFNEILEQE